MSKLRQKLATDNVQDMVTDQQPVDQQPDILNDGKPTESGVTDDQLKIVIDILDRVNNSADDIKSGYYSLLDNLNALNKDYPNVYSEFKLQVKLPNQNDIKNIVQFQTDIQQAVKYLTDPNFLSGVVR